MPNNSTVERNGIYEMKILLKWISTFTHILRSFFFLITAPTPGHWNRLIYTNLNSPIAGINTKLQIITKHSVCNTIQRIKVAELELSRLANALCLHVMFTITPMEYITKQWLTSEYITFIQNKHQDSYHYVVFAVFVWWQWFTIFASGVIMRVTS